MSKTLIFGFSLEAVPPFKLQESISYSGVISLPWAPGTLDQKRSSYCLDVDIVRGNEHHLIARNARNVRKIKEKKRHVTFSNFLIFIFTFPALVDATFDLMTSQAKCHLHQQRSHKVIISRSIARFDKDN